MKKRDEIIEIKEEITFERRLLCSLNKELNNPNSFFSEKDLKNNISMSEKKIDMFKEKLKW